ncbi:DUF6916 family protein [Primorskyibacter sp. 2E107]|uniref:DUF6916 family protein n=1 Tax=Primorskyibacter sp. 2E107 TaxID=3403458 RepID=UPI003AF7EF3F
MTDLATLTPAHFEGLTGQTVTTDTADGPVSLLLDNVKQLGRQTLRDNHIEIEGRVLPPRQAFVIVLEGPREPVLEQRIREIEFPELGRLSLFMVPFRQDHDCTLYEIGFS